MNDNVIFALYAEKILRSLNYSMFVYADRVIVCTRYAPGKLLTALSFGLTKWQAMKINSDITTYISEMTSVTFKRADSTNGKIAFSVPGKTDEAVGTGMFFRADSNEVAEKIAVFLESAINKSKETYLQGKSIAEEIRKLKELLDEGAITQVEFDSQKGRLLS